MKSLSISFFVFLMLSATLALGQANFAGRLMGELPPLLTGTDELPSNEVRGTLRFSAALDNNLVNAQGHNISDILYSFEPGFSYIRSTARLSLILDATPQFVLHTKVSSQDQLADSFGVGLEHRLAPHTTLRLKNTYKREDNPLYDSSRFNPLLPQFGASDTAPAYVIAPSSRLTSEQAEASVIQEVSVHSRLSLSGSFYNLNWTNLGSSAGHLIGTQSSLGSAMYDVQLSPHNSVGLTYRYQALIFTQQHESSQRIHSVYLVDTLKLSPKNTVQVFLGPQYAHVADELVLGLGSLELFIPFKTTILSLGGGVTYNWQGNSTGIQASVVHQAGGSGGFIAAARSTTGSVTLTHRLNRRLSGHLGMQVADEHFLGGVTQDTFSRLFSGSASATYKLTSHTAFSAQYMRGHIMNSGLVQTPSINADRISLSVEYQFRHALGR